MSNAIVIGSSPVDTHIPILSREALLAYRPPRALRFTEEYWAKKRAEKEEREKEEREKEEREKKEREKEEREKEEREKEERERKERDGRAGAPSK